MTDSPNEAVQRDEGIALSRLPLDELRRYATALGQEADETSPREELVRYVRQRQELLIELDREAMLDVIVWSRRPVRKSASKEELAKEIAKTVRTNYDSLSTRGLFVLAKLRGVEAGPSDGGQELVDRLRRHDGFWMTLRRKRRSLVGSLLAKIIEGESKDEEGEYRFLPEEDGAAGERRSLKQEVVERGLVGGIAQKLRGAADDYIKVKLDEIEVRIDAKLDQIDNRLGEWRDREVANRLKILRITLMFTVLVAAISLGYSYVKGKLTARDVSPPPAAGRP